MFGPNSEPVTTKRDVIAVLVPQGDRVHVPADTDCFITQALGGSYTIYIQGRLLRVDGADADALGKEPVLAPELPEDASEEDVEKL
ncbi:MAG: putative Fe-S cluster assembly protein SufT, partial [Nevskiales bacterium]